MAKEIKIEKEKLVKVKPRKVKTFMGEQMNEKPEYLKEMPDQRLHKIVSFIKSGVRITACLIGVTTSIQIGFIMLGIAELVGIIEEMV